MGEATGSRAPDRDNRGRAHDDGHDDPSPSDGGTPVENAGPLLRRPDPVLLARTPPPRDPVAARAPRPPLTQYDRDESEGTCGGCLFQVMFLLLLCALWQLPVSRYALLAVLVVMAVVLIIQLVAMVMRESDAARRGRRTAVPPGLRRTPRGDGDGGDDDGARGEP